MGDEHFDPPSQTSALDSSGTTPVRRPAARQATYPPASGSQPSPAPPHPSAPAPAPDAGIEVWYQPPTSDTPYLSPQPTFSFPSSQGLHASPISISAPFPSTASVLMKQKQAQHDVPILAPQAVRPSTLAGVGWREVGDKAPVVKRKVTGDEKRARKGTVVQSRHLCWGLVAVAAVVLVYYVASGALAGEPARTHTSSASKSRIPGLFKSARRMSSQEAESFRQELDPEVSYLTSPVTGDLAEQTMNLYHLAHLSKVLGRVPLLPSLSVSLAHQHHVHLPASQLFDIPRFRSFTNTSALDWHDVRPAHLTHTEPLGCWVGPSAKGDALAAREQLMLQNGVAPTFVTLRASTSRTKHGHTTGDELMESHKFIRSFDRDAGGQAGVLEQATHAADIHTAAGAKHFKPEQHLFCIDPSLYRPEHSTAMHVVGHGLDPRDHSAFHHFGKALHFTPELVESAADVASFMLGGGQYISVHIDAAAHRRECALLDQPGHCTPLLAGYAEAVERVRHAAASSAAHRKSRKERHHVRTLGVLVSTDVSDLAFLGELAGLGWTLMDYADLELRQRFGSFSAEVMDSAIHSRAVGFVGTRGSPEATLAALRVHSWRNGPVELLGVLPPGEVPRPRI